MQSIRLTERKNGRFVKNLTSDATQATLLKFFAVWGKTIKKQASNKKQEASKSKQKKQGGNEQEK